MQQDHKTGEHSIDAGGRIHTPEKEPYTHAYITTAEGNIMFLEISERDQDQVILQLEKAAESGVSPVVSFVDEQGDRYLFNGNFCTMQSVTKKRADEILEKLKAQAMQERAQRNILAGQHINPRGR